MRIPKLPFHAVIGDLLYSLLFQGDCVGFETILVSDGGIGTFTPPIEAHYAIIIVECDPTQTNKENVIRFLETGATPTAGAGMPLGHKGIWESLGRRNMQNFRMVGIEPGKLHQVSIQYYG